jgi:predicted ATPase
LHHRAQTLIGDFLCRVAASGVTVIVETQSDHVFNAVRLAVKSKIIPCADVNVYFFSSTEGEKPVRTVEQLQINKDGRMDHWPDGFFDEWDCSLDKLLTANETHEES